MDHKNTWTVTWLNNYQISSLTKWLCIRIICTLKYTELNEEPTYSVTNGRLVIRHFKKSLTTMQFGKFLWTSFSKSQGIAYSQKLVYECWFYYSSSVSSCNCKCMMKIEFLHNLMFFWPYTTVLTCFSIIKLMHNSFIL